MIWSLSLAGRPGLPRRGTQVELHDLRVIRLLEKGAIAARRL
jgi:hypothetical protein